MPEVQGTKKGNIALFPENLVDDVISKVGGHSSLMKISQQTPVAFNGNREFVFNLDSEVDLVAENGKKTHGGISLDPLVIAPYKVEYGARVSDEFLIATEESKIKILKSLVDGFAKKLARGLDLMAMHGINPRTGTESTLIGNNCFDKAITTKVEFAAAKADENLETAIRTIQGKERIATGVIFSTEMGKAMADMKENGVAQYPEFKFGGCPEILGGMLADQNTTVSANGNKDRAIVGDFANRFQWGYAKEIPLKVIEYGDPDNTGKDLKGYNQVYLRLEAYIGWGILDPDAFARIEAK